MSALNTSTDMSSLPLVREYVLSMANSANVPDAVRPKIDLVLEEVLVNIATHAYSGGGGRIEIECTAENGLFCCMVRDWGSDFNPLKGEMPDVTAEMDDRPIGGLGLLLITTMTDSCSYARMGDMNELTMCFSI